MSPPRNEDKLAALKEKKASADRMWDRVLAEVESGMRDTDLIGHAMHMCNLADRALMEYEPIDKRTNERVEEV